MKPLNEKRLIAFGHKEPDLLLVSDVHKAVQGLREDMEDYFLLNNIHVDSNTRDAIKNLMLCYLEKHFGKELTEDKEEVMENKKAFKNKPALKVKRK